MIIYHSCWKTRRNSWIETNDFEIGKKKKYWHVDFCHIVWIKTSVLKKGVRKWFHLYKTFLQFCRFRTSKPVSFVVWQLWKARVRGSWASSPWGVPDLCCAMLCVHGPCCALKLVGAQCFCRDLILQLLRFSKRKCSNFELTAVYLA